MLLLPLGYTIAELLLLLLLHGCRNESDRRGEIQRGSRDPGIQTAFT